MVKVSVVVPVYNAEKYIDKCINSIIKQTLEDIEIILINDGSRDKSLEICKKYEHIDSRVRVIDKPNSGVSSSRNIGIDISTGEYITFIDADDWIESNMIENLYIKAKAYKGSIVISNYFRNYINKEHIVNLNIEDEYLENNEIKEKLIFPLIGNKHIDKKDSILGFRSPWAKLFRLDIIKEHNIRFREELTIYEDALFNIEFLSKVNRVIIDKNAYYHYFNNLNSTLNLYNENCWITNKMYIELVSEFLIENNYKNQIASRFIFMKLDLITKAIFNECKFTNKKNIYKRIKNIDKICKDKVTQNTLKETNIINLDFKRKIGKLLIKNHMSTILYFYYSKKIGLINKNIIKK